MREVDEERSDEGSMKFGSSKCNEIVDGHTSGLSIRIIEQSKKKKLTV
jgi:hypothetical protein